MIFLCVITLGSPIFSEEIYRWTDDKGTVHFTDDVTKVPKGQLGKIQTFERAREVTTELSDTQEQKKSDSLEGSENRVKNYLEEIDRKIVLKKKLEKRVSEIEEELDWSEKRLKQVKEDENEYYLEMYGYMRRRTTVLGSPYESEKARLQKRIKTLLDEREALQERISEISRSL